MHTYKKIFWHEWLEIKRSRLQLAILAMFMVAGLYAIYYGNAEITKQQATIRFVTQQTDKEQLDFAKGLYADTSTKAGMAAYESAAYPSKARFFLNYYPVDRPSAFAKLSIGQRDVHPYYLQLNAQNLYLQLFRSEISNPKKLLAGNFDLAFVIIYLLPLLIIAFTYNLLSSEREQGTFALLKTQPISIRAIMFYKLLFNFFLIAILAAVVSIIGFRWSKIGFAQSGGVLSWLLTTFIYIAVWFALVLLVNSYNKSSTFNAIWLLGIWLMFLIVIPSVLNLAITNRKPVDATSLTNAMRRRQGMDETPNGMKAVLNSFYNHFPEYRNTDTSKNRFLEFKAYSAFVTLKDMADKPMVDNYFENIYERNRLLTGFDIINPAVNTQAIFNAIAGTGLENSSDFRNSVVGFHQQLTRFCFKPLFAERLMTKDDYAHLPLFKMKEQRSATALLLKGLTWLVLLSVGLLLLAGRRLKKI